MNWKYNTSEFEDEGTKSGPEALHAMLAATASHGGGGGGGNSVRVVENTVYFYGDITESNALDLNSTLHAVDKKLRVSAQFLEVNQ